ncbi:MAG: hypothetical protein E1N59_815 [Puniceicoccaceae bacterium 5H]|nr:MAG: hypothetical protein E1N59_815 [Puniceicoccaceae bacterium 5H]
MARVSYLLTSLAVSLGFTASVHAATSYVRPATTLEPVAASEASQPLRAASVEALALSSTDAVSTYRNGAEAGTADLELSGAVSGDDFSTYSVIQSAYVAQGSSAFRLANAAGEDYGFALATPFAVTAQTKLWFYSRMGFATITQYGRVQVSTDEGNSWTTIWSEQGPVDVSEYEGQIPSTALPDHFDEVNLSLADYAGQTVHLRFLFDYTGGSSFAPNSDLVGWFIDDIQVGETRAKDFYDFGDPTAEETLYLEYLNRARADAMAEAARLTANIDGSLVAATSGVDFEVMQQQFAELEQHLPPVAFNAKLSAAARLHSQDMYQNVFQGHNSSSNPPSPNQAGDGPGDRMEHQGYDWAGYGENVFAYAKNVWYGHAGFEIDWGGDAEHGMQTPPGHRLSIHNPNYKEVGIGVIDGSNGSVGPQIVTQDFGMPRNSQSLLTGVVYEDANANGFYDLGEGVGGARIEASNGAYYTTSADSGAYTLPLSTTDGAHTILFTPASGSSSQQTVTVTNSENVKLDWEVGSVTTQTPEEAGVTVEIESVETLAGQFQLTYSVLGAREEDTALIQLQAWGQSSFSTLNTVDLSAGDNTGLTYSGAFMAGGVLRVVVE